ncbi:MAG: hypothetical protein WC477_07125 [Patescibacteria group bacterium]
MKKNKLVNVTFRLPEKWIKMIDEDARRQYTTRTQIIKNWLKDKCLFGGEYYSMNKRK